MTDTKGRVAANDPSRSVTEVRDAYDSRDHGSLTNDPSRVGPIAGNASDASFPASDPPSQSAANPREPAPSSGYDAAAERAIARDRTAAEAPEASETHLTSTEASGGTKLGAMRYVLGISLATVILLFAVLLLFYR